MCVECADSIITKTIPMSLKLLLQYLLPHHILSRLIAKIANCRVPAIKNFIITQYCKFYHIDMSEALESDRFNYITFNDFFTRALKPGARPIIGDERAIVAPVDGKIWQIGAVSASSINAKGRNFTLQQLLADDHDASLFQDANFAVLYLAPYNYHRIHMPIAGKLRKMRYVPGKLFSVNPAIVDRMPDVFAINERVVSLFDTVLGPVAVVFVGAMIVGSIETKWAGVVAPRSQRKITNWNYSEQDNITFERGEEIGNFKLGSTVILLFPKGVMKWDEYLQANVPIKMGQILGMAL
jgi:phosphatidylserine decarboxylase